MMSQKRQQEDVKAHPEGSGSEDKRRRLPTFRNVVWEVMKMQSVQNLLEPILEPLIRRVVKEEVELALRKHLNSMKQNCGNEVHTSESRSLHLKFINNLSLPVFTGARIEGEDCSNIQVALVDAHTAQLITSGPESSGKVEIVVLEGDFDGDEHENWTTEEFKNNIVREREGKKPLLTGDAFVNLEDGTGVVGEISFTDNSSWTRSRRFRLGVRFVDNIEGVRVREAKTESFIVRDHRGELYKKHHPPSLLDEVWRLEKIGKDGAFHKRLSRENITTVRDFLTLLFIDPPRLRNILGTGMSAKMWEITVDHARTCVIDKRVFLYCPSSSQQKNGVVFNIVGQVRGLLSECQYVPLDKLSETEKADAQNLVISAFEHWGEVMSYDEEASLEGGSSHLTDVHYPASSPRTESSNGSKFLASHKIGGFDYTQCASSPDLISTIYSVAGSSGLDDYASLHNIDGMGLRYDPPLSFPGQVPSSLICDTDPMTQAFCDEDHLQFFDTAIHSHNLELESSSDLQSAVDNFLSVARSTAVAQMRWTKVFSVFKWFSIRKVVNCKNKNLGSRKSEIQ
ncbi:calmodulin-binding protein 60 A isoform X1 [Corylus avellana]|uniref:calmodulin-binding protein 60 A isoform X1 n=1 Tax=Corylus avellana TaxID=13451 RepID=UPI00286A731A|nr:calmodulin-binding protein 60 A isoform X1 [Corylus avellana]